MIAYKITNLVNGHAYIGITTRPLAERWTQHRSCAARAPRGKLHAAMRKHGVANFICEEIAQAASKAELVVLERGLVAAHGTYHTAGGYNLTVGGEGFPVGPHSEERCRKNAAARRKNWADPAYASIMRAKLSAARRASSKVAAAVRSDAARQRASRVLGTYARSAAGRSGRSARLTDPAYQEKMQAWTRTPEGREKRRQRLLDPAVQAKMREAKRRRAMEKNT